MNGSRLPVSARIDQWARRYDQARALALADASGGGWGFALLCRRGVVAWMRIWPDEEAEEPACQQHAAETAAEVPVSPSFDPSVRDSLVRVMAGMILHSPTRASA